jgi:ribosomal protein S5
MRQLALLVMMLAVPAVSIAAVETWTNVALVDTQCAPKFKEGPDSHTTKCALQCAKHGFGVITTDGSFLLLDEAGNQKAIAALKATKETDHLRATVIGDRQGDTIKVASLSLEDATR